VNAGDAVVPLADNSTAATNSIERPAASTRGRGETIGQGAGHVTTRSRRLRLSAPTIAG